MTKIQQLGSYLLEKYPYPEEFSAARLTKMIYLCDWLSSIRHQCQITQVVWVYHLYGPYSDDVVNEMKDLDSVRESIVKNTAGNHKRLIAKVGNLDYAGLTSEEIEVANHVIEITKLLNFTNFIELVYSTYPVVKSNRFEVLDLPALADEYTRILASE